MISLCAFLLAAVATLIGWVWITCSAGRESLPWGLACFFIGPLCLVYPIANDRFKELALPWALFAFGFAITFFLPSFVSTV